MHGLFDTGMKGRTLPSRFVLRDALLRPHEVPALDLAQLDELIQQARSTGLLGRLAALLCEQDLLQAVPRQVRWHLDSAYTLYRAHSEDILLEVEHVTRALQVVNIRPVLLKGAAYLATDDRARMGRLFSDVDIFVPPERLGVVEELLGWQGWQVESLSEYDERYYRQWMHELPPMIHRTRGIALDVHHSLLPLTSRIRFDHSAFRNGITASRLPGVDTLAAEDRILHSAAHLLLEGEFDHAFRDLSDLYLLIEQHTTSAPGFWDTLTARSEELGLERVLYYALRYLCRIFFLDVPEESQREMERSAPGPGTRRLMDGLFKRALVPEGMGGGSITTNLAISILYLRAHYLKMPLPLLMRHLGHKAFVTPFEYRAVQEQHNA